MAKGVVIEDWVLTDTDEITEAIIETSGRKKEPVVLVFEKSDDFEEYRSHDIFSPVIIDGQPYLRMPSSYTDASFLEGQLADMGYKPISVFYGKDCVLFEFRQDGEMHR